MSIKMKSVVAVMLMLLLGASLMISCSDGNTTTPDNTEGTLSAEANYEIRLVDAFGNPMKIGAVVQIYSGDTQIAMQAFDGEGVAKKTLARGDYSVALAFTSTTTAYYYDKDVCKLTATDTTLDVVITEKLDKSRDIAAYATSASNELSECKAYFVGTGGYHVELKAGRNYFLFTPTVSGTYEFYTDNSAAVVGYYGSTYFVQKLNVAESTERGIGFSVSSGNIGDSSDSTAVFVIGIDVESDIACTFKVERTGDPAYSTSDEPWTVYEPTYEIKDYTLPSSVSLEKFDITSSSDTYKLVYNENDKFYHLGDANGPVILVYLGVATDYIDSIQNIVDKSNLMKYFYDDDGKFVKRETYAECVNKYIEHMDEASGTYPLTKDLMYIITQHGEYNGWWKQSSPSFIYKDENGMPVPGVNYEIAWLSFCCYAQ